MGKRKFDILGMSCSACSSRIQEMLNKTEGVKKAEVNLLSNSLNIEYDENILSENDIINSINNLGYDAKIHNNNYQNSTKKKSNIQLYKLIVSIILLLPLTFLNISKYFNTNINLNINLIIQVILTFLLIIINFNYFSKGFKGLIHKAPNMDTLVALGATASVIYSLIVIFTNKDPMNSIFFESAGMILTFVSIGKYIESLSKSRTTDAITKLMELTPEQTLILDGDKEKIIPTSEVRPGDIIILKSGYRISVDGVIISGEGYIDESVLTGESMPVKKEKESRVYCGTTLINGYMEIEATLVNEDTALSKIIETVEEASSSKAPISKTADKVSLFFIPGVILISIITLMIWLLTTQNITLSINFAICVLVISCPCALGLATPTAIMVGTGKAAEIGILFKSSEALENISKTTNCLLDKTGTITIGKPVVIGIDTFDYDKDSVKKICASIENLSEHPLAKAIVNFYDGENYFKVENFNSTSGQGIEGVINNNKYLIGNLKHVKMMADNISSKEYINKAITHVYVKENNKIIAVLHITDKIKESSIIAINQMNKMGIDTYMLTGDNNDVANYVKEKTKVNHVFSKVLPNDKAQIVKNLNGIGITTMVGDGINDSPALAIADIGVAIGAGTDIAIDSADIVLQKNNLLDLVTSIDLSKKVLRIIKQNLFWAFIYNVICIPLAAGVLYPMFSIKLTPVIATIAMSISSVCVVLNALRLKYYKEYKFIDSGTTRIISIEGMKCIHCVEKVDKALNDLNNCSAVVDLETNNAIISGNVENKEIRKAIRNAGFQIKSIEIAE